MIKTRFAPSPTGELHIGGARTALFEYLFAKSQGGEFLLRIEDTDRERMVEGSIERIVESLKWLGIVAENAENPMIQSERLTVYKECAKRLVEENKAYICTCSKEELAAEREEQSSKGILPKYSGKCREKNLQPALPAGGLNSDNLPADYVIRMKMPETGKKIVHDLIRGDVEFDLSLLDDQVILKTDGFPTYHLASVVDDHEMEITHVIRAEEWLSSTPKHLVLYEMLGWQAPEFAHLSMILAPDRTKLSKRHGATSVEEYRKLGYLPEAIVNYIALLGWNPKDDREIFSLDELVKEFKIENVNKSGAIFNLEKLNSINSDYIKAQMSSFVIARSSKGDPSGLCDLPTGRQARQSIENDRSPRPSGARDDRNYVENYLADFGVSELTIGESELLSRGGFSTLKEMADYIIELRKTPEYDPAILIFKKSDREKTLSALRDTCYMIQNTGEFTSEAVQGLLNQIVSDKGYANGDVFWPVRVALSGKEKSPSPVELSVALGKEETIKRIEVAIQKITP